MNGSTGRPLGVLPGGAVTGLATLGSIGNLPAPGTWGSLVALPWVLLVWDSGFPFVVSAVLALAGVAAAVAICGEAEHRLGRSDPGCVILDEFTAMPLVFVGWGTLREGAPLWAVLLGGFAAFRFFDIVKPAGIRRLQSLPGGWGVALDDVAAAAAACATLHVAVQVAGYLPG